MFKVVFAKSRFSTVRIIERESLEEIIELVVGPEDARDDEGSIETYEVPAFPGVGLIAQDQDVTQEPENRLGIKGPFVLIGMERIAPDTEANPHAFRSIPEEQLDDVRRSLILTAFKSAFK